MIQGARSNDSIRARIEALGTSLSLPTVRKALGVLEGEHASQRRGGVDELMDIRVYEPGDEARHIDWSTSARVGRPMVVQRERPSTSRVWLLLDVGREMTGSCPSGEPAYEVAANALRMFAALSLRRSDDVSLVFGDAASITRVPFNGGFAQFERTLDQALQRAWDRPRNIDALLDYARRQGLTAGPVFCTRNGKGMSRTQVTEEIQTLCHDARVEEEKGTPRCLRKLYYTTRAEIEATVAQLVEQTHERRLEAEQAAVGWGGWQEVSGA